MLRLAPGVVARAAPQAAPQAFVAAFAAILASLPAEAESAGSVPMATPALRKRQSLPHPPEDGAANFAALSLQPPPQLPVPPQSAAPAAEAGAPNHDPAALAGSVPVGDGVAGVVSLLAPATAPALDDPAARTVAASASPGVAAAANSGAAAAALRDVRSSQAGPGQGLVLPATSGGVAARFTPAVAAGTVATVTAPTLLPPQFGGGVVSAARITLHAVDDGLDARWRAAVDRADGDRQPLSAGGLETGAAAALPTASMGSTRLAPASGPDAQRLAAAVAPPPEAANVPGRLQLDLQTADGTPIRVDMSFDPAGGAQLVVHANSHAAAQSLIERSAQLVDAMRDLGLAVDVDVRQGSGQTFGASTADGGTSSGSRRPPPDSDPVASRTVAGVTSPARSPARNPDISAALSFYA
jgi:hypothetical protein